MFQQNEIKGKTHKGIVGEELFAVLIVIILIFVFVFSVNSIYDKYIQGQRLLYAERFASSLAERIYFDNNGIVGEGNCQNVLKGYGNISATFAKITYYKNGAQECSYGNEANGISKAVASLPSLVTDANGKFYPAIITVEVGA